MTRVVTESPALGSHAYGGVDLGDAMVRGFGSRIPGGGVALYVLLALSIGATVSVTGRPVETVAYLSVILIWLIGWSYVELWVASVLVLFFLATSPQIADDPYLSLARWAALVVAVLGAMLGLHRRIGNPLTTVARPYLSPSIAAFAGVALLSTAWSISPLSTMGRAAAFVAILLWAVALRTYEFDTVKLRTSLRFAVSFLTFANAVVLVSTFGNGRVAGLYANPNHLGLQCGLLLPVALQALFATGSRVRRLWFGVVAMLVVVEGVLSGSRGGLVAMAAGSIFLLWSMRRDLPKWVIACAFGLPITIGLVFGAQLADSHLLSADNGPREGLWNLFPAVFLQAPVVGHGFGTTAESLGPYLGLINYTEPLGSEFHNSYLNVLSDLGAVGGAIFGWVLVGLGRRLWSVEPATGSLIVASLAAGMFESWFFGFGEGFALVFWLSVVFVLSDWRKQESKQAPRSRVVSAVGARAPQWQGTKPSRPLQPEPQSP